MCMQCASTAASAAPAFGAVLTVLGGLVFKHRREERKAAASSPPPPAD